MTIKIVTDSTCDLPQNVIQELGITVIPMFINIGTRGYLDGVEITRKDFYTNLPTYPTHPTTGTPACTASPKSSVPSPPRAPPASFPFISPKA